MKSIGHPAGEKPFLVLHRSSHPGPAVVAVFNPSTPDRTLAIKGLAPSPIPYLEDSYRLLSALGVSVAAIACNTMHYWYDRARSSPPGSSRLGIPTVHMIRETVDAIAASARSRAGLLATTGTVETEIYQRLAAAQGIEVLTPRDPFTPSPETRPETKAVSLVPKTGRLAPEVYRRFSMDRDTQPEPRSVRRFLEEVIPVLGEQEGLVMEAIYGYRGAKAGYTSGVAKLLLMEAARRLVRRGAEVLILGCTEVPLLLGEDALLTDHGHVACLDTTRLVAERLREAAAQGLTVGVAGGMGPEATIDMLWKLGVERSALDVLWEIVHTTATFLKRRQDSLVDQDHLKFVFLQTSSRTSRRCASSRIKPWTVVDTAGDCPAGTRPRRYWSGSVDRLVRESLARRANLG